MKKSIIFLISAFLFFASPTTQAYGADKQAIEAIYRIISQELGIQKSEIQSQQSLENMGARGIDAYVIVCRLEQTLAMDFPEEYRGNVDVTVQDIMDYVETASAK